LQFCKWLSGACIAITAIALVFVSQVKTLLDLSEDRRNSFPMADQQQLGKLTEPLVVIVHLAPEDPRYVDLKRKVLAKLERAMTHVSVCLGTSRQTFASTADDDTYGESEYVYGNRSAVSRSTNPIEILPLIYGLAGVPSPSPIPSAEYPGYPNVADGEVAFLWFLIALPSLILLVWWRSRRPPNANPSTVKEVVMNGRTKALLIIAVGAFALLLPAFAAPVVKIDFANETVGAEPKALIPVVGIWRMEDDGGKKVLAVDGRQWKEGQSSAGIADKARALYGERYAEFLDRVQAFAYFPYVVAKDVEDFKNGEIAVRFECLSGRIDQGAGILFDLKQNGDYFTVRANCLENNLVLWKYEKGKRSSPPHRARSSDHPRKWLLGLGTANRARPTAGFLKI
jgi:hypothetical protein